MFDLQWVYTTTPSSVHSLIYALLLCGFILPSDWLAQNSVVELAFIGLIKSGTQMCLFFSGTELLLQNILIIKCFSIYEAFNIECYLYFEKDHLPKLDHFKLMLKSDHVVGSCRADCLPPDWSDWNAVTWLVTSEMKQNVFHFKVHVIKGRCRTKFLLSDYFAKY